MCRYHRRPASFAISPFTLHSSAPPPSGVRHDAVVPYGGIAIAGALTATGALRCSRAPRDLYCNPRSRRGRSVLPGGFCISARSTKGRHRMSKEEPITTKTVLYEMPGTDAVTVRHDQPFGASGDDTLTMDLYLPPNAETGARLPAVIIVAGYPD